jgi:hypothetical protein
LDLSNRAYRALHPIAGAASRRPAKGAPALLEPAAIRPAAIRPAIAIRRLYKGVNGFSTYGTAPDGRQFRRVHGLIYGEVTARGIAQLIRATAMSADDCFVDLGSGTGKLALHVAMAVPGVRCRGIEIAGARHEAACDALRRAEAAGLISGGRVDFRHQDLLKADLSDATILFANSTCFSARLLGRLAARICRLDRNVTFVSLQRLSRRAERAFSPAEKRRCATSWDRMNTMHVYRRGA